jgi:hypothetical protein
VWERGLVYSQLLEADFFQVKAVLVQSTVNKTPKDFYYKLKSATTRL